MPTADTLILCIGNPSRGDDAAGALAATALAGRLAALPALAAGVSIIEDFQLQPEHVEDMANHQRCIIVDAALDPPWPPVLVPVDTPEQPGPFSHAATPAQLAWLFRRSHEKKPTLFTLGIPARDFCLGALPAPAVVAATDAVVTFLLDVLQATPGCCDHA